MTLCLPLGASAQVPQVSLPEVSVPPVIPQPLPPIPTPPVVTPPPTPPPAAPAPVPSPPPVLPASSGATVAGAPAADLGAIVERAAEAVSPAGDEPTGGTAEDRAAARAERRAARRARRARAREVRRRLRRSLRRHSHCSYLLTTRERRILRLHLGLGGRDARSRQAVARRLDTSAARIRRAERRAVVKLRRASRSGSCDSAGLTTVSVGLAGAAEAADLAVALGAAAQSGGGVLGERESGGGRGGESRDAPGANGAGPSPPGYALADADDGLATLAWIALVAAGLALLAGVFGLWRRGVLGLPHWFRRGG